MKCGGSSRPTRIRRRTWWDLAAGITVPELETPTDADTMARRRRILLRSRPLRWSWILRRPWILLASGSDSECVHLPMPLLHATPQGSMTGTATGKCIPCSSLSILEVSYAWGPSPGGPRGCVRSLSIVTPCFSRELAGLGSIRRINIPRSSGVPRAWPIHHCTVAQSVRCRFALNFLETYLPLCRVLE
jgi:hypothetical protein